MDHLNPYPRRPLGRPLIDTGGFVGENVGEAILPDTFVLAFPPVL